MRKSKRRSLLEPKDVRIGKFDECDINIGGYKMPFMGSFTDFGPALRAIIRRTSYRNILKDDIHCKLRAGVVQIRFNDEKYWEQSFLLINITPIEVQTLSTFKIFHVEDTEAKKFVRRFRFDIGFNLEKV